MEVLSLILNRVKNTEVISPILVAIINALGNRTLGYLSNPCDLPLFLVQLLSDGNEILLIPTQLTLQDSGFLLGLLQIIVHH